MSTYLLPPRALAAIIHVAHSDFQIFRLSSNSRPPSVQNGTSHYAHPELRSQS